MEITRYWDSWCCITSSSSITNFSDVNSCSAPIIHATNDSRASMKLDDGVRSTAFVNCSWRSPKHVKYGKWKWYKDAFPCHTLSLSSTAYQTVLHTHSRNLYQKLVHVSCCTRNLHACPSVLYKFFLVRVSCMQLSTAIFQKLKNLPTRDSNGAAWLAG